MLGQWSSWSSGVACDLKHAAGCAARRPTPQLPGFGAADAPMRRPDGARRARDERHDGLGFQGGRFASRALTEAERPLSKYPNSGAPDHPALAHPGVQSTRTCGVELLGRWGTGHRAAGTEKPPPRGWHGGGVREKRPLEVGRRATAALSRLRGADSLRSGSPPYSPRLTRTLQTCKNATCPRSKYGHNSESKADPPSRYIVQRWRSGPFEGSCGSTSLSKRGSSDASVRKAVSRVYRAAHAGRVLSFGCQGARRSALAAFLRASRRAASFAARCDDRPAGGHGPHTLRRVRPAGWFT